jgi:hypothetical protein
MAAIEVFVNGELVSTIGVGERGVMHAMMGWISVDRNDGTRLEEAWVYGQGNGLAWPRTVLKMGDEVTMRLVEREAVDRGKPIKRP